MALTRARRAAAARAGAGLAAGRGGEAEARAARASRRASRRGAGSGLRERAPASERGFRGAGAGAAAGPAWAEPRDPGRAERRSATRAELECRRVERHAVRALLGRDVARGQTRPRLRVARCRLSAQAPWWEDFRRDQGAEAPHERQEPTGFSLNAPHLGQSIGAEFLCWRSDAVNRRSLPGRRTICAILRAAGELRRAAIRRCPMPDPARPSCIALRPRPRAALVAQVARPADRHHRRRPLPGRVDDRPGRDGQGLQGASPLARQERLPESVEAGAARGSNAGRPLRAGSAGREPHQPPELHPGARLRTHRPRGHALHRDGVRAGKRSPASAARRGAARRRATWSTWSRRCSRRSSMRTRATSIHRDMKPENIMVEPRRGEPDFVKVLDFGIAKILDSDLPGLTRADVVCGTPQYMAPEQATGSALDHRCDLYAVGVILYQLATGFLPFDGQNSMEVLTRQVNDPPEPPRSRAPAAKISAPMERLILRALEKEPSARPQTAAEFRRLLIEIPEPIAAARDRARRRAPTPRPGARCRPSRAEASSSRATSDRRSLRRAVRGGTAARDPAGSTAPSSTPAPATRCWWLVLAGWHAGQLVRQSRSHANDPAGDARCGSAESDRRPAARRGAGRAGPRPPARRRHRVRRAICSSRRSGSIRTTRAPTSASATSISTRSPTGRAPSTIARCSSTRRPVRGAGEDDRAQMPPAHPEHR